MVIGICDGMCPAHEIQAREEQRRLAVFETKKSFHREGQPKADPAMCVKEYVRSAAGRSAPQPQELRTAKALAETTDYLLGTILDTSTHNQSWSCALNFVTDRLRCVRQDIITQQLPWQHAVPILQKIVRYHVLLLKENHIESHPNESLLQSYISDLHLYYDIAEQDSGNLPNRLEFLSYAILLNVTTYNVDVLIKSDVENLLTVPMEIVLALATKDFARLFKRIDGLTLLQFCCLRKRISTFRVEYLKRLNACYSNKLYSVPLVHLRRLLHFDNIGQVETFLGKCDVDYRRDDAMFNKLKPISEMSATDLKSFCTVTHSEVKLDLSPMAVILTDYM